GELGTDRCCLPTRVPGGSGVEVVASELEVLRTEKRRGAEQQVEAGRMRRLASGAAFGSAGIEPTDVRLTEHPPLDADGREVLTDQVVVLARLHVHDTDVVRTDLSGHLRAEVHALRGPVRAEPDAPREEG